MLTVLHVSALMRANVRRGRVCYVHCMLGTSNSFHVQYMIAKAHISRFFILILSRFASRTVIVHTNTLRPVP